MTAGLIKEPSGDGVMPGGRWGEAGDAEPLSRFCRVMQRKISWSGTCQSFCQSLIIK
jgi:hypothetical protein